MLQQFILQLTIKLIWCNWATSCYTAAETCSAAEDYSYLPHSTPVFHYL